MNIYQKALDILRERGWAKGMTKAGDGAVCVGLALEMAQYGEGFNRMRMCASRRGVDYWQPCVTVILEQYPEYAKVEVDHPVCFNDKHDITFMDIERVLEKTSMRVEEGQ